MNDPCRLCSKLAASSLVGLTAAAILTGWSVARPDRALILSESSAFPLGVTIPDAYQRHSWSIRNGGPLPLKLRTHFTSGRTGFSLWLGEDRVIPAGGLLEVTLSCPTPSRGSTTYSGHADVFTNDPILPRVRFRLFGKTGPDRLP